METLMAKRKSDNTKSNQGNKTTTRRVPEFKPGNKPYAYFGKEILNKDVPWHEIVNEILLCDVSKQQIADEIGVELQVVKNVLQQNTEGLTFKAGTRLITIHCRHYSAQYAM